VAAGFGVTDGDVARAEDGRSDAEVAAEEAARDDRRRLAGLVALGTGLALLAMLAAWRLVAVRRLRATA
jgi:hypothetical protein